MSLEFLACVLEVGSRLAGTSSTSTMQPSTPYPCQHGYCLEAGNPSRYGRCVGGLVNANGALFRHCPLGTMPRYCPLLAFGPSSLCPNPTRLWDLAWQSPILDACGTCLHRPGGVSRDGGYKTHPHTGITQHWKKLRKTGENAEGKTYAMIHV